MPDKVDRTQLSLPLVVGAHYVQGSDEAQPPTQQRIVDRCETFCIFLEDITPEEILNYRFFIIVKSLDDLIDIPSPSKSITPQDEVNATEFTVNFSKTYFAKFSLNYYQNAVVDVIQNAHFPGNPNPVKSHQVPRSKSIESRNSRIHPHLERRDSVMKMAYERFSTIIQWSIFPPLTSMKVWEQASFTAGVTGAL
ncbi:unnamed protein product [Gongylonema pulchrum]|uniref:PX domain-containing protein n=1 Tax=Gongylonema pulchrum TaxID=637853 RepID=A0A183DY31_9BILA|nr:unnamed protein product [Gongylonema pulchrum]